MRYLRLNRASSMLIGSRRRVSIGMAGRWRPLSSFCPVIVLYWIMSSWASKNITVPQIRKFPRTMRLNKTCEWLRHCLGLKIVNFHRLLLKLRTFLFRCNTQRNMWLCIPFVSSLIRCHRIWMIVIRHQPPHKIGNANCSLISRLPKKVKAQAKPVNAANQVALKPVPKEAESGKLSASRKWSINSVSKWEWTKELYWMACSTPMEMVAKTVTKDLNPRTQLSNINLIRITTRMMKALGTLTRSVSWWTPVRLRSLPIPISKANLNQIAVLITTDPVHKRLQIPITTLQTSQTFKIM